MAMGKWFARRQGASAGALTDATRAVLEPLEPRLLLSSSPVPVGSGAGGADLHGTVTITDVWFPPATPDPADGLCVQVVQNDAPGAGLLSYTIRMVTELDDWAASFDGQFAGPMNQVWDGEYPTPTLDDADYLDPDDLPKDTHLLFYEDDLFILKDPDEDGPGTGSYLAHETAEGIVNMAFGIKGDIQQADLPFAQVVVPQGEQVHVVANVGNRMGGGFSTEVWLPALEPKFSFDYEVTNGGDADAGGFWVDFYSSDDPDVFGDAGDELLERVRVDGLLAGQSASGTFSDLVFPGEGTWYLGMVIDPEDEVVEDDEENNTGPGQIADETPAISIDDVAVAETDAATTSAEFTVTLSAASGNTVTVDYATADGTASAGSDYEPAAGTLTFDPGTVSRTVAVTVYGETTYEPDETFTVVLDNATNATLADWQGVGTIQNDDSRPTLSIGDAVLSEGDDGTTVAEVEVALSAASNETITVDYATADGTASAGSDYQPASGTLTFDPGAVSRTVAVDVNGDVLYESDETFTVSLDNAVNATVTGAEGVVTIENDDNEPALSIGDVTVDEGDAGTVAAEFEVTLSGGSSAAITVDYATADGTASAGSDYESTSGTLTFDPFQGGTQTVTVLVIGDTSIEVHETFFVNLTNATNAAIADAEGLGTIQDNDGRTIPFDAETPAEYPDESLDAVKVSLKGPGWGEVVFVADEPADGWEIVLNGTTEESSLTITAKGDEDETTFHSITVHGSLNRLKAKTTHLGGDLTVDGSLAKLKLGDVADDHTISIGPRAPDDTKTALVAKLGRVADTSLISQTPVKSLTAIEWSDTDGVADTIETTWLSKLTIKGDSKAEIAGDFGADLTLAGGVDVPKATLGGAKIAGEITGGTWNVAGDGGAIRFAASAPGWTATFSGDVKSLTAAGNGKLDIAGDLSGAWTSKTLGKVTVKGDLRNGYITLQEGPQDKGKALSKVSVKGWIDASWILSAGHLGTIKAGAMRDSVCVAGVKALYDDQGSGGEPDGVPDLPYPASDLYLPGEPQAAAIKSFTVKGIKEEQFSFLNSSIAAAEIGKLYLTDGYAANEGVPFGAAADHVKKLTLKDLAGKETYKDLGDPEDSFGSGDFQVRLV